MDEYGGTQRTDNTCKLAFSFLSLSRTQCRWVLGAHLLLSLPTLACCKVILSYSTSEVSASSLSLVNQRMPTYRARLGSEALNLELGQIGLNRFPCPCGDDFSGMKFISHKTRRLNYLISKVLPVLNSRTYLALNLTEYHIVFSLISSLTSLPKWKAFYKHR